MRVFRDLIAGQWVDASDGETLKDRNSARADEVIGAFPLATRQDAERAIAASCDAHLAEGLCLCGLRRGRSGQG
jgi:acyl-CoA reductase-like NAD-dependent aldehyde dehydrogenase